jgi:predicted DNA-binding transcriptional regulator YafY
VKTLTDLLIEAALKPEIAQQIIDKNQRISIYYRGDETNPKGWRKFEPAFIDKVKGKQFIVGYEIETSGELKKERSRFELDKIVNWNLLSTAPTTFNPKEDDPIVDAIRNKRVVSFYYKGDKEEAPGYRTGIEPVCYGKRKGIKYLRAWQKGGKSVSAEKGDKKRQLPSWRFFRVDRIRAWKPTGTETFTDPPSANFNPYGDKLMDTILIVADFIKKPGETLQESIIEAVNIF